VHFTKKTDDYTKNKLNSIFLQKRKTEHFSTIRKFHHSSASWIFRNLRGLPDFNKLNLLFTALFKLHFSDLKLF